MDTYRILFLEFPFWNTCFDFLFSLPFWFKLLPVYLLDWVELTKWTPKSLWAAVMRRRATEDQQAAQHHLLPVKWNNTIYNESHLNASTGWFEYKSTAITPAVAAGDIYQRVVVLRLESSTFQCCWTFSEQTKRAEQEVYSPLRSLHSLLVNGLIYHNFWCFARGRNKGSVFWGTTSRKDYKYRGGSLISVDYLPSLPETCCWPRLNWLDKTSDFQHGRDMITLECQ